MLPSAGAATLHFVHDEVRRLLDGVQALAPDRPQRHRRVAWVVNQGSSDVAFVRVLGKRRSGQWQWCIVGVRKQCLWGGGRDDKLWCEVSCGVLWVVQRVRCENV